MLIRKENSRTVANALHLFLGVADSLVSKNIVAETDFSKVLEAPSSFDCTFKICRILGRYVNTV